MQSIRRCYVKQNVGGAYDTLRETVQHMKQPVYYEKQPDPEK